MYKKINILHASSIHHLDRYKNTYESRKYHNHFDNTYALKVKKKTRKYIHKIILVSSLRRSSLSSHKRDRRLSISSQFSPKNVHRRSNFRHRHAMKIFMIRERRSKDLIPTLEGLRGEYPERGEDSAQ